MVVAGEVWGMSSERKWREKKERRVAEFLFSLSLLFFEIVENLDTDINYKVQGYFLWFNFTFIINIILKIAYSVSSLILMNFVSKGLKCSIFLMLGLDYSILKSKP